MHKRYNLFIHYINNYILSACYIPDTSLGTRHLAVSQIELPTLTEFIYSICIFILISVQDTFTYRISSQA